MSDKPEYIRSLPLLNNRQIAQIDEVYRKRLQSLQAVDEMIGTLVRTLRATGQLDNTYIFFSSDNGFHLGNHRLVAGKVGDRGGAGAPAHAVNKTKIPIGQFLLRHMIRAESQRLIPEEFLKRAA